MKWLEQFLCGLMGGHLPQSFWNAFEDRTTDFCVQCWKDLT